MTMMMMMMMQISCVRRTVPCYRSMLMALKNVQTFSTTAKADKKIKLILIYCCSVPQLNTLRVTRYVHLYLYMYKYRYTA